jgi:hypothetical protein
VPLDHYVSQVHLKQFYSPSLENMMHAIGKRDLKAFTTRSEDVCRIDEGSTNAYLKEDRKVEEFLKAIEPKYRAAVEKLANNSIDNECIYTIAGFVAYVISCSPAGMRILSGALQHALKMKDVRLDSHGLNPTTPPELVGMNLPEIRRRGLAEVDADPKFPQAVGVNEIIKNTEMLGNFKWEVLHNDFEDSPYFTSDYPVAIEKTNDLSVMNKVIPLSPSLAIRIQPDREINRELTDSIFAAFDCQNKKLDHREVEYINKLIVRCAEQFVFFRDNHAWVSKFVQRNSMFCIKPLPDGPDITEILQ